MDEYPTFELPSSEKPVNLSIKGKPIVLYTQDAFKRVQDEYSGVYEQVVFDDTHSHWAKEAISELYRTGVIQGRQGNVFMPNEMITRAEFIALIARLSGSLEMLTPNFADVFEQDWFYKSVGIALHQGLITENEYFFPSRAITRQEMAVVTARYLKLISDKELHYADKDEISEWAVDSVAALTEIGVAKGSENLFMPLNALTRAEAAQIIYNISQLNGGRQSE